MYAKALRHARTFCVLKEQITVIANFYQAPYALAWIISSLQESMVVRTRVHSPLKKKKSLSFML